MDKTYEEVEIEFLRVVELPRFSMQAGERWKCPRSRFKPNGELPLGGGTVRPDEYREVRSRQLLTTAEKLRRERERGANWMLYNDADYEGAILDEQEDYAS